MKSPYHQMGAHMLGWAIGEIAPQAEIVACGSEERGFWCRFKGVFNEALLPQLEHKMRQAPEGRTIEMIPWNAAELLHHHKQSELAFRVAERTESLIQLIEMDNYYGVLEGEGERPEVVVLDGVENEGEITTIRGAAFADKKALKAYRKLEQQLKKCHRKIVGPALDLCSWGDEGFAWHPRGWQVRQKLIEWWEGSCERVGGEPERVWARQQRPLPARYGAIQEEREQTKIFCSAKDLAAEITSSLQFMTKLPKILNLESRVRLYPATQQGTALKRLEESLKCGGIKHSVEQDAASPLPKVDLVFIDRLGREHAGPTLTVEERQEHYLLTRSTLGSLERLVGLILEQTKGSLPTWLSPEQVRLLPTGGHVERLNVVRQELAAEGVRVGIETKGSLSSRIAQSQKEMIPYTVVVGPKEEKGDVLNVRQRDRKEEQTVTLKDWIADLRGCTRTPS